MYVAERQPIRTSVRCCAKTAISVCIIHCIWMIGEEFSQISRFSRFSLGKHRACRGKRNETKLTSLPRNRVLTKQQKKFSLLWIGLYECEIHVNIFRRRLLCLCRHCINSLRLISAGVILHIFLY